MCSEGEFYITETFSSCKLRPYHGQKMIPAGIVLYIAVSVIFLDKIIKVITVKEYTQLIEKIWNLTHLVAICKLIIEACKFRLKMVGVQISLLTH